MHRRSLTVVLVLTLVMLSISACGDATTSSPTPTATGTTATTPLASVSPVLSPTSTLTSAPLQVTGVSINMNPSNFSTIACGTSLAIVFTAQINVTAGSGGLVPYTWNIDHATIPGNVTFAAGQASQAVNYTLSNAVIQLNSATTISGSISAGISGATPVTANVVPTGVCRLPGPFKVISIVMSVNPSSVNGVTCGTEVSISYIATVTIAANSNAGTVALVWNLVTSHPAATLFFAPAQTVGTVSITIMQKALRHSSNFPRAVSIASTSPDVYNAGPVQPAGQCA